MQNLCYIRKEKKKRKEKKTLDPSLANFMKISKMTIVSFLSTSVKLENFTCKYTIAKAAGVSLNVLIMVSVYSHFTYIFHLFRSDGCMEK
jgi:hypothetical protein